MSFLKDLVTEVVSDVLKDITKKTPRSRDQPTRRKAKTPSTTSLRRSKSC